MNIANRLLILLKNGEKSSSMGGMGPRAVGRMFNIFFHPFYHLKRHFCIISCILFLEKVCKETFQARPSPVFLTGATYDVFLVSLPPLGPMFGADSGGNCALADTSPKRLQPRDHIGTSAGGDRACLPLGDQKVALSSRTPCSSPVVWDNSRFKPSGEMRTSPTCSKCLSIIWKGKHFLCSLAKSIQSVKLLIRPGDSKASAVCTMLSPRQCG